MTLIKKDIIDPKNSHSSYFSSKFNAIYSMAEKISAASYLLAQSGSDSEPATLSLKESAVNLLRTTFAGESLSAAIWRDRMVLSSKQISAFTYMLMVAQIISEQNYQILKEQILRFLDVVIRFSDHGSEEYKVNGSTVLSRDFFEDKELTLEEGISGDSTIHENFRQSKAVQGQTSRKFPLPGNVVGHKGQSVAPDFNPIKRSPSFAERKMKIKDILKGHPNLTVRDLCLYVKGVSEKTIQRDLVYLLQAREVRKEGKLRWTRYFFG